MIDALRTCVIPDLDDQLVHGLGQAEELLLTLAAWEEDPDGPGPFVLPGSLAGRTALEALNRIQDAVLPTQTRTDHIGREIPPADSDARARMLGPDGRYEHLPLRLVAIDQHDLDVLAAAAAELGRALATRSVTEAHEELVESLRAGAEAAGASTGSPSESSDPDAGARSLVETLARAHGLLDLADTDDTALLRKRLTDAAGRDVVLTTAEEAAYQRLAERMNTMWTSRDPMARWLY